MQKQARLGLKQRRKAPKSKKAGLSRSEAKKLGIASGVARAYQLSVNKTISEKDAKKVARFYARFKNKKSPKAEMALKLWGGRKFGRAMYKKIYGNKRK